MPKNKSPFQSIRTEGALLPPDILQRIASLKVDGARAEDYHLPPGFKVKEAITASWTSLRAHWANYQEAISELESDETGTAVTNERWLLPLFKELDYGRLTTDKSPVIDEKSYPIERFYNHTPIHLIGWNLPLDRRTAGARGAATASPHSMMQEFLNRSDEHLWAFVSNGRYLRILRDNISLSRQAFVEFDLEAMFDGEVYSDFALMWLLCHQSRVEAEKPEECWLENWSGLAREQGTRVLKDLRLGVERSIEALGQGFISHPKNDQLIEKLQSGNLSKDEYYRQLLRIVYRLLFLFVAEDRELLHPPDADPHSAELYDRYYSTRRLREMSLRIRGSKHSDLWHSLSLVFDALGRDEGRPEIGLVGLGSFLWRSRDESEADEIIHRGSTRDLLGPAEVRDGTADPVYISNDDLLLAIRALAYVEQDRVMRVVDYRNLGSEELGSVYESLLELNPLMQVEARSFSLSTAAGNERKTSGSYYTPDSLVQCLLDSALEPVVAERLKEAKSISRRSISLDSLPADLPDWTNRIPPQRREVLASGNYTEIAEQAILSLTVCDPASGSGHFLIAAAHRLARQLARVRTGESEPSPEDHQHALRDIIGRCIYGVDINPMAVELCKVSLWMEAIEPGRALSFLDHHILCGNSLLGTTPALLKDGVPDNAFKPIEGDIKDSCTRLKKRNKRERQERASGQGNLFEPFYKLGNLPGEFARLDIASDDSPEALQEKEKLYADLVRGSKYLNARLLADAWCSTFVWKKDESDIGRLCPTESDFRRIENNPHSILPHVRSEIRRLSLQYQFFHWHLSFPDVFVLPEEAAKAENEQTGWSRGFDVVLGNPPWEKIQSEELQFFSVRSPEIANLKGAKRKSAIKELKERDPGLARDWARQRRKDAGTAGFIRQACFYERTGVGKFNTFALFSELNQSLLNTSGRVGCIVPTGIATDDTTKAFFRHLVETNSLISLFDFENREAIFPNVHKSYKFSLLTATSPFSDRTAATTFVFFALRVSDLLENERRFTLGASELRALNPNTLTCPTFRFRQDADLAKHMYRRVPVFLRENCENWYSPRVWRLLNTTDDSGNFSALDEADSDAVPLLEAKMVHQFDHRYATFDDSFEIQTTPASRKQDAAFQVRSRHYVPRLFFNRRLGEPYASRGWHLTARNICRATDERTVISSLIPRSASCEVTPYIEIKHEPKTFAFLNGVLNSFVFDYCARQKVGGTHLSYFILYQLPVVPARPCLLGSDFSLGRNLELTYTAWDLEAFSLDCGYDGPPFRWDDERRFLMRCELDAAYFHLYLGPAEAWGADNPELHEMFRTPRDAVEYIMETFPIVKRKDIARTEVKDDSGNITTEGRYITKDTILDIYDRMAESMASGQPYQTQLDPPPGPPTDDEGNFVPLTNWDKSRWPSHIHQPR